VFVCLLCALGDYVRESPTFAALSTSAATAAEAEMEAEAAAREAATEK